MRGRTLHSFWRGVAAMSFFRGKGKIRWGRLVLALFAVYIVFVAASNAAKNAGGTVGGTVLLVVIAGVVISRAPRLRGRIAESVFGGGRIPWHRDQLLGLRWQNEVLFPGSRLDAAEDQLREPWPRLLRQAYKRGDPILFIPYSGQWVASYGTEARVTRGSPLFEFEGIRRMRIAKSENARIAGTPFSNVFHVRAIPIEDEVDRKAAEPLVRQLRSLFGKWAASHPDGKKLTAAIDGQADPAVLTDLVAQALFRYNPTQGSTLLGAGDVNYRLRAVVDWLKAAVGASAMPGLGTNATDIEFEPEDPDDLPKFADVGGMAALKEQIHDAVNLIVRNREEEAAVAVSLNGILLFGPPGTGKTMIAQATAGEYALRFLSVSGGDITGKWMGESEARLRSAFRTAGDNAPCLLFLDEFDSLAGKRGEGGGNEEHQKRVVTQLLRSLEEIRRVPGVVLMAATNDLDSLDPAAVRAGRFDFRIRVDLPDAEARTSILTAKLRGIPCAPDLRFEEVVSRTQGRSAADIAAIVESAKLLMLKRAGPGQRPELTQNDLIKALTSRQGGDRPTLKPVAWDDVILPEQTKAQLMRLAEMIADSTAAAAVGVRPPRGALLYGPPGTGKTTIAQAVATATNGRVSFLPVKGSDIRSKWIGDGAKRVRDLFARARASSPTIIFIDEIEYLVPKRGQGDGYGDREAEAVVTEFLQQLDGIDSSPGVFVLGATNLPDKIDPAALRGGRLERKIEIPLPDASGREQLLQRHSASLTLHQSVQLDVIARLIDRFSGADIESLCQEAATIAYDRDSGPQAVTQEDWLEALRRRRSVAHVAKKNWDDLILPEETLRQLKSLARLMAYPEAARGFGVKPATGALLWGPPGTGKTTVAQVLASQLEGEVSFLSVKGSDVKSKWVGESEKQLRELFERARAQTPAMIFIDEIDTLVPSRERGLQEASASLLTEFLQQLAGLDSGSGVFVLGATNVPENIDSAVLRGGRLGRTIEIPLPTAENRERLFALHTQYLRVVEPVDVVGLSEKTAGASGADIEMICNDAAEHAFNRDAGPHAVTREDFDVAVSRWQSAHPRFNREITLPGPPMGFERT